MMAEAAPAKRIIQQLLPGGLPAPAMLDGLWLALLALYILAGAPLVPFHGDESTLMFMGRDYHYLFGTGDFDNVRYDPSGGSRPDEQHLRILNGTISKMIYGWLQAANGIEPGTANRAWSWEQHYDENVAQGALPAADLLQQARLSSALQLALAVTLFFALLRRCINRPTAYLASALFALHPNVLINGRRAMMEGSHLLGLMLLLCAAAWLLSERKGWRYALLGICAGFALAAKHPNAIACTLVFLASTVAPVQCLLRSRGREWRRAAQAALGLALAGTLTVLVFLGLNPAWWQSPPAVAADVIAQRQSLLQEQIDIFGGYTNSSEQLSGFLQFTIKGEHQYFEDTSWASQQQISLQIAAYEGSGLAGALILGESARLSLLSLLLAGYGALRLARGQPICWQHRWLLLLWCGGSIWALCWLTPLPWARYYLPLLPGIHLLTAYGLTEIYQALRGLVSAPAYDIARLA